MQVYVRPKKILLGSSLAFNLKEGYVRCVKVCDKSWVILKYLLTQYLPKVRPYITFEVCMHQGSIMEIFSSCPVLESLELQNCSIQDSNHHDHHLQCRQRSHSTDVKLKQLIIVSKCSEAFIDSLLKRIEGTQWGSKAFRSQFKNLQRPYSNMTMVIFKHFRVSIFMESFA